MADDSEVKPQETPGLHPVISEEIIIHPVSGNPIARLREKGSGKFVKSKKTMPEARDVTRLMRNFLNQPEAGPDGKMRRGDVTRMRKMLDNIFNIASLSPDQPLRDRIGNVMRDESGRVLTAVDAKIAMASVQAFKELMLRAYGKPSASDEEIDALKTQGVKVVVIQPPDYMINREVKEEKPREKLMPSFIQAEIIENS